jgi:hypothetical protein
MELKRINYSFSVCKVRDFSLIGTMAEYMESSYYDRNRIQ